MIDKNELLKLLPKLIREDDEIKGAIITALSGVVATKDDIARMIDHSNRRFEAVDKRFEAMDKRFEELIKQMNERTEIVGKRFEDLINEMNTGFENAREDRRIGFLKIEKSITEIKAAVGSIGDRSGKALEDTIIELLNDKLIQENIQASKIHKEIISDKEGIVFTKHYSSDIDVLIEDGKIILIDIKYHTDNNKIFNFF